MRYVRPTSMPKQVITPPDRRTLNGTCWLVFLAPALLGVALAAVLRSFWPLVLALPLSLPLAHLLFSVALSTAAFIGWRVRGVHGLLVYSESPNWHQYIDENWLPRAGGKLRTLNWTERARWRRFDLRVLLFHWFVGATYNFNPAVVLLRPLRLPLVFRFYPAFKNAKHGNVDGLQELEERLFRELGAV